MTNFIAKLDGLYGRFYHPWLCSFSLIMAIGVAASVMWDPIQFADAIGGLNLMNAIAIVWATCAGFVHGLGFKAQHWFWQLFFFPPLIWTIFLLILVVTIG